MGVAAAEQRLGHGRNELGGGDVLRAGGQPGAKRHQQLLWRGQRLGRGQRGLYLEQRGGVGDAVAQHVELWQRFDVHQCAGGR